MCLQCCTPPALCTPALCAPAPHNLHLHPHMFCGAPTHGIPPLTPPSLPTNIVALLPHPSTPHHATPHFCKCGPCTRGCLQVGKTTGQQNLYRWVWVCQVQVGVAFLEPLPNPYPCMGTPKFFQQIMFRLDHDQCHCQMPLDQSISILISTLVLNFSKPAFWSPRL